MVVAIGLAEFIAAIGGALLLSKRWMTGRNLPRVALLSAGIFVAQMVNFPVGGGTTGHLIGGALFAILAGPAIAIVGMTAVLLIQALMFGDGGITALGLNALNMAVIAPLSGWGVYTLTMPVAESLRGVGKGFAIGMAAWASVFLSAAACAAELSVSFAISGGAYGIAATISVPAMLGYHAVIGVGEAIITAGIVAYLLAVSPEFSMNKPPEQSPVSGLRGVLVSKTVRGTIAVLIVFAATLPLYFLYASEGRDGLEQTMADSGAEGGTPLLTAPFSYGEDYFNALLAGIAGFLAVTIASLGILRLIERLRSEGG